MDLQDVPIEQLKHAGVQSVAVLRSRGVLTVGDLLARVPRRYLDLRAADDWTLVRGRVSGATLAVVGTVADARRIGSRDRPGLSVLLRERGGLGALRVVFFHAPSGVAARAKLGATVRVVGVLREVRGELELHQPRWLAPDAKLAKIEPVYGAIGTLTPAAVGKLIASALARSEPWGDPVPAQLARDQRWEGSSQALRAIHAPPVRTSVEALVALARGTSPAHRRLAMEELLAAAVLLERARQSTGVAPAIPRDATAADAVARRLGFSLTPSQTEAIDVLQRNMSIDHPMRRLLVGDVGSGKTAVAAAASLSVLRAGRSVVWLAPTSIVAEQHAATLSRATAGEGGPVAVILGSTLKRARATARAAIASGQVRLVVGTLAVLEEGCVPPGLGLAVVDEQHRFGVAQRASLVRERAAHLLVVSATPIPRTLALAQYGDLDVVTMPRGPSDRQPVTSRVVSSDARDFIARTIERALSAGDGRGRAFVVVPRIEADEATAWTVPEAEALLTRHFPRDRIVTLHGRMSPSEQRAALGAFRAGTHPILVGTSVVEVGLDVPEANLMVVLGAEHFGVAQLHQLRGRVGRGGQRAACLFVAEADDREARARLDEVAACGDGFALAERDLARRGAGEWFGERQSGADRTLRFADPLRDRDLVALAVETAREILHEDPSLDRHPALDRAVNRAIARGERPTAEDAG